VLGRFLRIEEMTNNKAREHTSPLIEELLNEVTPEEMERTRIEMENMDKEFDNTKLNYIANTLKETANRMEYIGDISDLGNEIGVTVGRAYENMTEENINDFIYGFRHGISLTNGTH
jgi:predicted transcriptional regulator